VEPARHAIRNACALCLLSGLTFAQQTPAEQWIEAGHWKRARTVVEARMREAPRDPLANFLLSQIRGAFGDRSSTPLSLAETAVSLDGRTARYHRQVAEVLGVSAQHANAFQQLMLARRFRKEIDAALALDGRDVQAHRDLLEFYLLAPGIAGGSRRQAAAEADRIAALDAAEGLLAKARVASFDRHAAQASAFLKEAANVQPPSYRAHIALAEFSLEPEHADPAAAESAARDAIAQDPGRADAYAELAAVYAGRGASSELDAVLDRAGREVGDDLYPSYRAAASLLAGARDLDRAARYLRAYMAQEPEGNRPTQAEAARLLERVEAARHRSAATMPDRAAGRIRQAGPPEVAWRPAKGSAGVVDGAAPGNVR
jgi:hypothetical protein